MIDLSEDQYKSPTRRMIQRQTMFRSSFGPSKSFGGVTKYNGQKSKHMKEYYQGSVGKITDNLKSHDCTTIIPKGSYIKIVDPDPSLPDIEFEGKIINVDGESLSKVFKQSAFIEQVDKALAGDKLEENNIVASEFEARINETFGGIVSIVEPDILITINQVIKNRE
jgi:hypothetical protein